VNFQPKRISKHKLTLSSWDFCANKLEVAPSLGSFAKSFILSGKKSTQKGRGKRGKGVKGRRIYLIQQPSNIEQQSFR